MRRRGLWVGLFLLALAVRLVGLDFDQNHFFHPDERAIGDAILKLSFHPLQLNPHFFAYGSLPLYLTKALSSLLAGISGRDWFASYDGVIHVGRFLSALAGALTVLLVASVGRRLYGQKAGLCAGLLLALAVLHIQTSHFASTDVTLTLFVLLALASSGRFARRGRGRDALLAGALTGFALATKASAAPLLLPLAVAVFFACRPARAWRRGTLLSAAANRFLVKVWPFRHLALTNFLVARPRGRTGTGSGEPIVSVIVPARNEAGNIEGLLARVPEMGAGTEIVFVEGHSSDDTYGAIENAMARHPERRCQLHRQAGKGKGDAVRLGFAKATGDVLMILDADLTVPPEDLPRFYEALRTLKGDFINGVRLVYPMEAEAMRFPNFLANKFFSIAFTFLLGQPVKDTLCGTKVL